MKIALASALQKKPYHPNWPFPAKLPPSPHQKVRMPRNKPDHTDTEPAPF